jgi:hypothetical protein
MSTTYNYTTSDFIASGGGVNSGKLDYEIRRDITGKTAYVLLYGVNVDVVFNTALSGGEEATLDGIIATHTTPWVIPGPGVFQIPITTSSITSTSFVPIGYTTFPEGNVVITNIKAVSAAANSDDDYQLRVRELNGGLVVASGQFSNTTTSTVQDLGTITNNPVGEGVLVLEALTIGGGANPLQVYSVNVYYS